VRYLTPSERVKVATLLDAMAPGDWWPERHLVGPDEVSPAPFHEGQNWTWDATQRWVAMLAGTQGGKSQFGPWWLKREIERRGQGDYIAGTSSYDLFKLKLLPALLKVFVDVFGIGRYWGGDRLIEICEGAKPGGRFYAQTSKDPMWARIILRSAESEGGLEAATAKAAWLDEAGQLRFDVQAWHAIKRRLALHQGRVLITTTLYALNWVKQLFIDPLTEVAPTYHIVDDRGAEMTLRENDDIALIQFDSIANPSYPLAEFEEARATMPPDEFAMFWRGMATKLRSAIFDCFDRGLNVVKHFEIPYDWVGAVGIDPVGAHVAAVWGVLSPRDGKFHIYREYREPFGKTTQGHAEEILRLTHERIARWIIGQPGERQPRLDWKAAGIDGESPPFADLWVGIGRVYSMLKSGDMVIHDNCEGLLSEIGSYQREKDKSTGELTDKIRDKHSFDLCDATRYMVADLTEPRDRLEVVNMRYKIDPFS